MPEAYIGDHVICQYYSMDDGWIWVYFNGDVMGDVKCNESIRIFDWGDTFA